MLNLPRRVCKNCPNIITHRYNKLCWSCIGIRKRYKLTKEEWKKEKARRLKVCTICGKQMTGTFRRFKGKPLCEECREAMEVLSDPGKRKRIVDEFSNL